MIQEVRQTAEATTLWYPGTAPRGLGRAVLSKADGRAGSFVSLPHARVLIVEDEYFVALDTEEALSSAGFTVVGIATTAEEATSMAAAELPDIVLMDIRLAGSRDGIDAATEIRSTLGIPSLFATAHSDAATRARGEKAAAPLGWLTKPYNRREVTFAVAEAIAKTRKDAPGNA